MMENYNPGLAWEEEDGTEDINQDHVSTSKRKSKKTQSKSNGRTHLEKNSLKYKEFRDNNNISVRRSRQKTKERQQKLREEVQALGQEISAIHQEMQTMEGEFYTIGERLHSADLDIHYIRVMKGLEKPDNCDECQKRSLAGFSIETLTSQLESVHFEDGFMK